MEEQAARLALGRIFALRLPRSWEAIDLGRFPVANYIVFSEALEPALEASRARLADARQRLESRGIEALFMMDEEGGRVTQTAAFFPSAPSARAVARALAPEQARELYAQLGAFLRHLGVDIDLAPCLDVVTNEINPIIGTRAFGCDPETVSHFGEAAISGFQGSMACVAKHFPGHGMTRLDSHLALPVVDDSRETLERVHGAPFRRAASLGVDGMMASHCVYGGVQSDGLPASLSRQIVRDHLRGELGYDGLVFTDSLDMKAITENFSAEQAAAMAFEASCDVLLYTEIGERFETAFEALVDLLVRGRHDQDQVAGSLGRRARLLDRLERRKHAGPGYDPVAYLNLAAAARAAATRIGGRQDLLPLGPETLVVGTAGRALRRIAQAGFTVEVLGRPDAAGPDLSGRSDLSGDPGPPGKSLLLWLAEPLTIGRPLEALRATARAAAAAALVTTYDAAARALPECSVRVVTDDLSPATEDSILQQVLGIPPAS